VKKKSSWYCILGKEHRNFILNYVDKNPSAILTEVVGSLMKSFVNPNISRNIVYNFMTTQRNLSIK
jgi:hypothetical protein